MAKKTFHFPGKGLRRLRLIFRTTGVSAIFQVYFAYFIASALLIWMLEPSVTRLTDSIWYCFETATTIGFGDFAAATVPGRIVTIILSVYSLAIVAIFTAVITGYVTDTIRSNAEGSVTEFLDDLEHLPDLTPDELAELSERVKNFRARH